MWANPKLFSPEDAVAIRNRRLDRTVVLTNGCFDLLTQDILKTSPRACELHQMIHSLAALRAAS
jgi:bifunctional ADP-heptose synthase (sugar kinase/adenylyltransferase)